MKTKIKKSPKITACKNSNYKWIWSKSGNLESSSRDPKIGISKRTNKINLVYDSRVIELSFEQIFEILWTAREGYQ